ncbi:MAG TPA: AraC family transcriptional regulator ligand-binding domain-containing protein, partial [Chthoniobacterales bacterium]
MGVDLATARRGDAQMPFNSLVALYEEAARLTGDDAFGLRLGQESDHTKYDLLGYIVANSHTYGDALEHLVRYVQVWTSAVHFSLTSEGGEAHLAYIYGAGAVRAELRRQESEHMLSTMLHIGRQLTGIRWKPSAVCFEHAQPTSVVALLSEPQPERIVAGQARSLFIQGDEAIERYLRVAAPHGREIDARSG